MNYSFLEWDSNFFGIKICRIDVESHEDIILVPSLMDSLKSESYDLIYVFVNDYQLHFDDELLTKYGGCLVDEKVIYSKYLCSDQIAIDENIESWKDGMDIEKLYKLSIQSGAFSRYCTDSKIGYENFIRLYHLWIDNSIAREIADDIFVYQIDQSICGFVTVTYTLDKVVIGLIAVDESYRGRNIGSSLISYVEKEASYRMIKTLDVATQKINKQACSFYVKNSMQVKRIINIYHFWI